MWMAVSSPAFLYPFLLITVSFDVYLWSFTGREYGQQIDGHWKTPEDVPTVSEISIAMSKDMKKRGISFVGPVITYSFLQSIGIVNDHLADCEYR